MHLVLDPAHDAAHGGWLRGTPGAYEWWYFDAVSDDGVWALACIWFLGNPFSPYYRQAALGDAGDPYAHNSLFFALYRRGRLHAYHFTRFPTAQVCADEVRPATLRFGPNDLAFDGTAYRLSLADENANRRVLNADVTFASPLLAPSELGAGGASLGADGDDHYWLPAAPSCRVTARITLREAHSANAEEITFNGHGYHDHNWGTLPFAAGIRDWYWARAAFPDGRTLILYHVDYHAPRRPVSHLLLFENGVLTRHDPQAQVHRRRPRLNAFGAAYASRLDVQSGDLAAALHLGRRLDSAPFYIRALCNAALTTGGSTERGAGMAEYFRPRLMGSALAASAMKARIVAP